MNNAMSGETILTVGCQLPATDPELVSPLEAPFVQDSLSANTMVHHMHAERSKVNHSRHVTTGHEHKFSPAH